MTKRIDVIVSQGQSQNPVKRQLEEDLIAALMMEPGIDVTVVPHLYDLAASGTGVLALQGITGDMVVISWLFSRAAYWTLDRHDIRGQLGESLLDNQDEDELDSKTDESPSDRPRVMDERPLPPRKIYCLDLRWSPSPIDYVEEVKRIAHESGTQTVDLSSWVQGKPTSEEAHRRFLHPTNSTALGSGNGSPTPAKPARVDESAGRRWYPVIDFSRCTNCMECIDFCLFGVYGVDDAETILVEQPDNCRKGCPACSRVCPENAIMFPQHKTPAIAGAPVDVASMKIDLSQLFGGADGEDAAKIAAQERDEQLTLAGREAVGTRVGMPKRQADRPAAPKDKLDNLIDALDDELDY